MENEKDVSVMDEVKSPPLLMIGVFLFLIGLAFIYVYIWAAILSP